MTNQHAQWISEIIDAHYTHHMSKTDAYHRIGDLYVNATSHVCDVADRWELRSHGRVIATASELSLAQSLMNSARIACELVRVIGDSEHVEFVKH
jgi:hypothetical protein